MSKVIIFGLNDFAELSHYYLEHDSIHEVVAFSVNEEYIPEKRFYRGLPIVPFETVEQFYSPDEYEFFAPMAPRKMVKVSEKVYHEIKAKGYKMISYISSKASVFDNEIGDNCFILEDNTIQPFTKIGNNVVLWSGNHIGHHGIIKDHVHFTSHVVLSGHCIVESYCFFGVNSTIRNGITLAEGTFVAMSTSITRSTEPWGVYKGSPGKKSDISSENLDFL